MLEPPSDLPVPELTAALRAAYDIDAATIEFLPLGAGTHQWSVRDSLGRAWFLKVNDLRTGTPFDHLRRSLRIALTLRRDAGLDFVLAPLPTKTTEPLRRLSPMYALSVYPLLDGVTGPFQPHPPAERPALTTMLAALHRSTPAVTALAPRATLTVPGRDALENALTRPWSTGPYAEPARRVLTAHQSKIHDWLAEFDQRATTIDPSTWVLTHGEPHPGNLLRTGAGAYLIDWDTVRIAPPERDLWMLTSGFATMLGEPPAGDDEAVLSRYHELTGHPVSLDALALYRLQWILTDLAIYADELRRPHTERPDLAASLHNLTGYLRTT